MLSAVITVSVKRVRLTQEKVVGLPFSSCSYYHILGVVLVCLQAWETYKKEESMKVLTEEW